MMETIKQEFQMEIDELRSQIDKLGKTTENTVQTNQTNESMLMVK